MRPHPLVTVMMEDYKTASQQSLSDPSVIERKRKLKKTIWDNFSHKLTKEQLMDFKYYSNPEYFPQ